MTLNEYQQQALTTALFSGDAVRDLCHWALGVAGEAGEVADKVKKVLRDADAVLSPEDKTEIAKELGDVLWYIAVMAQELGVSLEDVGDQNITKLRSRQARGVIGGSGDNR